MKKGFTLIEAVLTMVIIGVGITGVLAMYQQNIAQSNAGELTLKATYLAQEKMEQIIHDKKYKGYSSIISGNYPSPENMMLQGFPGYTRTTTILEVNAVNWTSASPGSGYKRITVDISVTGGPTISLTTLLTHWGTGL